MPDLEDALRATHSAAQGIRARREWLRKAIEQGDEREVLRYARLLLGMDDENKGNRPTEGVKRSPGGS